MSLSSLVRDHIPLEQGLRPESVAEAESGNTSVRDHITLEQGLRQDTGVLKPQLSVRDHIPLEQGLRQSGQNPSGH